MIRHKMPTFSKNLYNERLTVKSTNELKHDDQIPTRNIYGLFLSLVLFYTTLVEETISVRLKNPTKA